jgi:hypothetical protein
MKSGQSTRSPFLCARCGSLYDKPEKLVACLARHEDGDRILREAQGFVEVTIR